MNAIANWFERKFDFTFPVELYPNLCVRLRGTPARIEELLRGCDPSRLIRKPSEKWSIQEHAGHLADLESLWLARVEDYLSGVEQLTAADLRNRKTDEANHNTRELSDILAEFRKARFTLVDRLDQLRPADYSRTMLHPRLQQPMRMVDHLFFAAEHDDHHLARIWELCNEGLSTKM
jgi:uncharacterized damage-inducible protein DinB